MAGRAAARADHGRTDARRGCRREGRDPPLDVRTGRTGAGYPADLVGAAGAAGHERPDHGHASRPHCRRAEPGPGDPGKDHGDGHRCSVTTMRERGRELTIVAALAMLSGYLSLTQANFRDAFTISTILTNAAYVAVVGIGMTIVIVAGQIDISVGSMLAVCALITGTLARAGVPMPLVVLASLLLGLGMGALNGALVAYLRVPSIIVTLATLTVLRGAIVWWTKGYWVMPLPPGWKVLGTTHLLGLPLPVWIGWAAVLAASILLAHTVFGREIYAAGSHPQAAQLNGIDTARVTFWVFALNGLLVGLATMLHVTRFSMVQTQEGLGLEFLVITAVVVGGTNIFGGSGTVMGTYLGVLLLTVTSSALTFLGISATWDQAIRGAFILVPVTADIVRTGRWRQPVPRDRDRAVRGHRHPGISREFPGPGRRHGRRDSRADGDLDRRDRHCRRLPHTGHQRPVHLWHRPQRDRAALLRNRRGPHRAGPVHRLGVRRGAGRDDLRGPRRDGEVQRRRRVRTLHHHGRGPGRYQPGRRRRDPRGHGAGRLDSHDPAKRAHPGPGPRRDAGRADRHRAAGGRLDVSRTPYAKGGVRAVHLAACAASRGRARHE